MFILSKQLPGTLLSSLENSKGFNKSSFEAVHYSGEQVTSVRLNPQKWIIPEEDLLQEKNDESMEQSGHSTTHLTLNHSSFNIDHAVPWCPYAYYLKERPSFTQDPYLHAGMYYVQEASSMFLWEALQQTVGDKTEGLKVLDLCAAPGGKSTLLASYFYDGLLVSNEVIKSRASILVENISKWGTGNVIVSNNDPKDFKSLEGYFDVMVVDAPCSGSGLFRRDADAIDEWSEENVQLCSQRQQRILADAYNALKEDGILIYSTCSYSKEEDEDIIDWICRDLPFENIRLQKTEAMGIIEVQSEKMKAYGYRFYPDKLLGEGLFIAVFKKKGESAVKEKYFKLVPVTKAERSIIQPWLNKEDLFLFKQGENVLAIANKWSNDTALLQKHLYLRKAGVTVGSIKGKELVPHHELAVSLCLNKNVPFNQVDISEALAYLKKKEMALPINNLKGWTVAKYKSANLGWMKILSNRINNYYPTEWRILKD